VRVAHHADGFHWQDDGKSLPEPDPADLLDEDLIGKAKDIELFAVDLARTADRQAGTGKRMAADERVGQAKLAAERVHLALEQLAQRQAGRQPCDKL
jgi:hypothetical protein